MFLPAAEAPPVVILAHGFGAEYQFGTASSIDAFVAAGYAVFAFDYRSFGASQGKPRQLVDPTRHCEDWDSAINYVRSLHSIDAHRIALWGSSFGGGHVLSTAAHFHRLQGVIAQVPFCSSRSMSKAMSASKKLTSMGHAFVDLGCSLLGREHRVALVGRPDEGFAIMDWPGWYDDYMALARGSTTWTNSTPARSLLRGLSYNPMDSAGKIQCPVLIISGTADQGIPRGDVLETVRRIPRCEHIELEFDHFDLYDGFALNETAIALQLKFLAKVFTAEQPAEKM
jgi:pimeloyl-ACP methyl ester carboxylesterase